MRKKIKNTLAKWSRRGIKVIYILVAHDDQGNSSLNLYLCGEEKIWLFPNSWHKNHDSYILAVKSIYHERIYDSDISESYISLDYTGWMLQFVSPLSKEPFPCLVQLVGECKFRLRLPNDNSEPTIIPYSLKFKTELDECSKIYRIKYVKNNSEAKDRWKIEYRYLT